MTSTVKILYVTTVSDTVNAFLIPHIKMLIESGYKVDVACSIDQVVSKEIYEMNCKIHKLDFNRSLFKNNYGDLVSTIRDIVTIEEYDIVHTHTPIASAVVRLACKDIDEVKIIYTAHGFHFYTGAPIINWMIFYPIEKLLSNYTDVLVTINQEDYRRALKFNAKKVKKINGVGIDLTKFNNNIKSEKSIKNYLNLPEKSKILFSVGELNTNKNHKIIIKALALLNNENIHYVIAGEGKQRDKLFMLAKELGVVNQVHLIGFKKNLAEIYPQVDIFLFPSYREGLSASVMEAMASGLPVICSNIRGNSDLIEHKKGGYLVKGNNPSKYSYYISNLLKNKKLKEKLGIYNLTKIQIYSIESVLIQLEDLYKS